MALPIVVQGVSKKFRRYHPGRPTTLIEAFVQGLKSLKPAEQFWALRDVSFSVLAGSMVGVIGMNGAGKSTLLSLIGEVMQPDSGFVQTTGRIGALLHLGAGFHPDLTGRENVMINGVIAGLTRREVAKRFDEIVAFAELESFIDSPLRTYSTGMQMRLAFALAVHIEPEILLIDEVLAVGDINFQHKCLERINQFKAQGCAILFVSHDTSLVSEVCDEAIWLDQGQVVARGNAQNVVEQYLAEMEAETRRRTPAVDPLQATTTGVDLKLNENRFGSLEMKIDTVRMLNSQGEDICYLENGEGLTIVIDYVAPEPVPAPIFGVTITRSDGLVCWDGNTRDQVISNVHLDGKGRVILSLDRLDLAQGEYFVDVGIYQQDWAYAYDYHWHVYPLEIGARIHQKGILLPPHSWKFEGR